MATTENRTDVTARARSPRRRQTRGTTAMSASRRSAGRGRQAPPTFSGLADGGDAACALLKIFSNRHRLQILCILAEGEKSVSELETMLGIRQAALSQHLSRLRNEKAVAARRDGKNVYYSLANPKVRAVIDVVYSLYCDECQNEAGCALHGDHH